MAPAYRADRILVQPRRGVNSQQLDRFHALHGGRFLRSFKKLGGIEVVDLPAGTAVPQLVSEYRKSGLFEFAEPDYIRETALVPNDPKYLDGTLWGLNNLGQNGGTPGADIDAPAAWDIRTSASNIVVAILDTGIRYTHQDLASNIWVNPEDGSHGTNSVAGTSDANDDSNSGHGTIMAGVIGGVGSNGIGVTGVAWDIKMMACKCFDSQGLSSDSAIIAAMEYAQANGARIMSASFDGPGFGLALSNAIYSARAAGILFVASAGNNGADIDVTPRYPSCYQIDNIISVAYLTRSDTLGSFSNYGRTNVDLAAPGDQIYSTFNSSDSAYWPPAGLPINVAGTSYAAAYVSGTLALLCAEYPSESYTQIISRLLQGTVPVSALAGKCATGGRLNLRNALRLPIRLVSPGVGADGNFQFEVSADPNRTCVIEAAGVLGTWLPVFTNTTDAAGSFQFSEPLSTSSPARFYRAVAQ